MFFSKISQRLKIYLGIKLQRIFSELADVAHLEGKIRIAQRFD